MAQENIQEGESVDFTITLLDEPAFDFLLCFFKRKSGFKEIAKFAYPAKAGFITMSKDSDDYLCEVPKNNTIGAVGATQLEVQFIRGAKTDITEKTDYRPIVSSLSPLSK